ncbi:MAG: hypothetical protein ABI577_01390 [bacterium]
MQLIGSGTTITAAFSQKVKDTIRIRQQQLVAIDTTAKPAEISWRWFIGEVIAIDGEDVTVRRLDLPDGSTELVSNRDHVSVNTGDFVYYNHGDGWGIVSQVTGGRPSDPAGLATKYLPGVISALTS